MHGNIACCSELIKLAKTNAFMSGKFHSSSETTYSGEPVYKFHSHIPQSCLLPELHLSFFLCFIFSKGADISLPGRSSVLLSVNYILFLKITSIYPVCSSYAGITSFTHIIAPFGCSYFHSSSVSFTFLSTHA